MHSASCKTKAQEIAQVPNVYRNSTSTTAVSRASNVPEGVPYTLPGLGYYHFDQDQKIEPQLLDTRGWALQERPLSPRTIECGSQPINTSANITLAVLWTGGGHIPSPKVPGRTSLVTRLFSSMHFRTDRAHDSRG